MTDQQLIEGLIARDDDVTEEFFYVKCRPLFRNIIRTVFKTPVDYDEVVNELYQLLMKDDAYKLKQFDYRSSFMQWLKTVALRHFLQKRNGVIEDRSMEPPYTVDDGVDSDLARMDLERLFGEMGNKRYVDVLRMLMLKDMPPDKLAEQMGITTANLYNIKKRAMAALTRVALKDIINYGKK